MHTNSHKHKNTFTQQERSQHHHKHLTQITYVLDHITYMYTLIYSLQYEHRKDENAMHKMVTLIKSVNL